MNSYGDWEVPKDAESTFQDYMKQPPKWFDERQNIEWKAAMQNAQLQQSAVDGLVYWNIGSDTSNLIPPKIGDEITIESIMAMVRHEMEREVAVAVVKCQHCGMWAARYCACGKCGAPVD